MARRRAGGDGALPPHAHPVRQLRVSAAGRGRRRRHPRHRGGARQAARGRCADLRRPRTWRRRRYATASTIYRAPVLGRTQRSTASILSMVSFWPIGIRHGRAAAGGPRLRRGQQLVRGAERPYRRASGPAASVRRMSLTMAGGDIYDPSKWYTPDKNPLLGAAVRRVLAASDGHVAVSTDLARRARSLYGFRRPIDVISLGAAAPTVPAGFAGGARARARTSSTSPRSGRLVRRKNLASLIRLCIGSGATTSICWSSAMGRSRPTSAAQARELGPGVGGFSSVASCPTRPSSSCWPRRTSSRCRRCTRLSAGLSRGDALRPAGDRGRARRPGGLSRATAGPASWCRTTTPMRCCGAVQRLVGDPELRASDERAQPYRGAAASASPRTAGEYESLFSRIGRVERRRRPALPRERCIGAVPDLGPWPAARRRRRSRLRQQARRCEMSVHQAENCLTP